MTPKEKANDLVDSFYQTTPNEYFVNEPIGIAGRYKSWEQAKECALIAINEMIDIRNGLYYNDGSLAFQYLDQVKQEIENL